MQLTERHIIKKTHPNWNECDELAFCSKNLFNSANYQIRQSFIWQGKFISYETLASEIKESEPYRSLPCYLSREVTLLCSAPERCVIVSHHTAPH
jgi:putative transposase